MPSKKKKYNARFPAGRIKKIMQSDEEIGKVAQAVPVIISRTLELFVESLLTKTLKITNSRNSKTLSPSHMKQCIMAEQRFDFLRELVKNIPDISVAEEAANYNDEEAQSSPEEHYDSDTPYDLSMPSSSARGSNASTASANGGAAGDSSRSAPPVHPPPGQNGSGSNPVLAAMRAHLEGMQHRANLKRESDSLRGGGGSVIRHTASVANMGSDCLPPKLSRCESTPAASTATVQYNWPQSHAQSRRLKHQSHSIPGSNSSRNFTAAAASSSSSTSSGNNNATTTRYCTPQKQQTQVKHEPQPQTAIPAPIVSFDFCNKPVVKIDYSNCTPTAVAAAAPLSAPANLAMQHTQATSSAFHFSTAEPVINIDLSNIVGSVLASTSSSSPLAQCPAIATISIGAIPPADAAPTATNTAAPLSRSSNLPKVSAATATSVPTENSFFELDEDYDNI